MQHRPPAVRRLAGVLASCLALAALLSAGVGGHRADRSAAAVLAAAHRHLGDRYVWGATGPASWDCSGLTSVLWRRVGGVTTIPRTAAEQQQWAVPVPREQALPGDLVFFGNPVTHVGLVQSRDHGDVVMVDASSSRGGVVERAVWRTGLVRFGRVPRAGMPAVTPFVPEVVPPTPRAAPARASAAQRPRGLAGLPVRAPGPSSRAALHAVDLASRRLGPTTRTDRSWLRRVWRDAGGHRLPADRQALVRAGHRVPLRDARPGDVLVYGVSNHLALYVGHGLLIDVQHGRALRHRAWAARNVRLLRMVA